MFKWIIILTGIYFLTRKSASSTSGFHAIPVVSEGPMAGKPFKSPGTRVLQYVMDHPMPSSVETIPIPERAIEDVGPPVEIVIGFNGQYPLDVKRHLEKYLGEYGFDLTINLTKNSRTSALHPLYNLVMHPRADHAAMMSTDLMDGMLSIVQRTRGVSFARFVSVRYF